jgi:hypothetical protein
MALTGGRVQSVYTNRRAMAMRRTEREDVGVRAASGGAEGADLTPDQR